MKIPVVFAFDDNYALPASVAIMSLQATKNPTTEYEVIVLHNGLRSETMRKFERICPIRWLQVSGMAFGSLPRGWSGVETWYRLVIANLLPEYDRVIWSDGDVLFRQDIAKAYSQDIGNHDWMGVCMELADENLGIHNHFRETINRAVYTPCFMVINARKWRENDFLARCKAVVGRFGERLTFYDLDVLNLAAESIGDVPIKYSVFANLIELEKIESAKEYPWLVRTHGREDLLDAVEHPAIIHYAGCCERLKPWERIKKNVPAEYWEFLSASPFYEKNYYSPRCPLIALWLWDSFRFLVEKNLMKKNRFKLRAIHWENGIKGGPWFCLLWLYHSMRRFRLAVKY